MKAFTLLVALAITVQAGRRGQQQQDQSGNFNAGYGHGGRDHHESRGGDVYNNIFGSVEWYPASGSTDPCTGPTTSSTASTSTSSSSSTTTAATPSKYLSLSTVTVCDEAAVGASKCICVRGSYFRRAYSLRCGTCQLVFTPNNTANGVPFGALVKLDDESQVEQLDQLEGEAQKVDEFGNEGKQTKFE